MKQRFTQPIVAALVGAVVGIGLFGLVRFIWLPDGSVHYHANFAVIINGQREQFKGSQYYQEIASCDARAAPQSRAHLHNNNNHVVHVHDSLVTWSDLFTNLGWSLGDTLISDGMHTYEDGKGGKLNFILNGQPTRSIADEVIRDKDRLLVSFGNDDSTALGQQFDQVESDALHYDQAKDPAACSGSEQTSLERLRRAVWW